MNKFWFLVMCYGLITVAAPLLLLAELWDAFPRATADVLHLVRHVGRRADQWRAD